jgi:PKD repeat protein
MNGKTLHVGRNVQWIPIALMVCLVVLAFGSAIRLSPPPSGPASPSATFFYSPSLGVAVGNVLTFDASLSDAPSGYLSSYYWSFGDGASASGKVVTHAYQQGGQYSVTLLVTDNNGLTSTRVQNINVYAPPTTEIVTPTYIYVDSIPITYQIGDTLSLTIKLANVTDLFAWQAGMTFNSSVLEVVTEPAPPNAPSTATATALVEGDFLKQGGKTLWFPGTVGNGLIVPHGSTLVSPATPVSGSGVLATVTFRVIGEGALNIHLYGVVLIGPDLVTKIPVLVTT